MSSQASARSKSPFPVWFGVEEKKTISGRSRMTQRGGILERFLQKKSDRKRPLGSHRRPISEKRDDEDVREWPAREAWNQLWAPSHLPRAPSFFGRQPRSPFFRFNISGPPAEKVKEKEGKSRVPIQILSLDNLKTARFAGLDFVYSALDNFCIGPGLGSERIQKR